MALLNVAISIVLCQKYGAIGSAIGTAVSLVVTNGIIMNYYYHKKCNIDIICFWKNILRLGIGLIIPVLVGILINKYAVISNIWIYLVYILIYSCIYCLSMWFLGMNTYEKNLLFNSVKKLMKLICVKLGK